MKIIKGIFYAILVIVALVFIIALFLPSQYKVERSTKVDVSLDEVYGFVADFNNFHSWNPWTPLEPDHSYEVDGDSGSVGQQYSWKGEIIGSGNMVFTNFDPNSIKSNIEFLEPQQANGLVEWGFEESGNGTKVSWSITGDSDYPLGRYFGLMMDNFLGPDFEKGMDMLKDRVEKR
jgi:carbon monoxide dehydrogenase subunit G